MNSLRLVRSTHPAVSDVDVRMMERAISLARQAALNGEVPIAAIVYRGEEILAEAANNRERAADPTGHAEVVAIREAGRKLGEWRLSECSMVVTLEPCPMCAGATVNARIGRLIYGATDPKAGACAWRGVLSCVSITIATRLAGLHAFAHDFAAEHGCECALLQIKRESDVAAVVINTSIN